MDYIRVCVSEGKEIEVLVFATSVWRELNSMEVNKLLNFVSGWDQNLTQKQGKGEKYCYI